MNATSTKGRKPLDITDQMRATARDLAASGAERSEIAAAIGVSLPTLRKHFADELATPVSSAPEPPNLFDISAMPITPAPAPMPRAPAGGRPAYRPCEDHRTKVTLLAGDNTAHADIARVLGISEPTLRKHYRSELDIGPLRKRADLLAAMERTARKGNVAAQKALLEILDRGALERVERTLTGFQASDEKPKAPESVGKKVSDAQAARDVAEDPEWRNLLQPSPENTSGTSKLN